MHSIKIRDRENDGIFSHVASFTVNSTWFELRVSFWFMTRLHRINNGLSFAALDDLIESMNHDEWIRLTPEEGWQEI